MLRKFFIYALLAAVFICAFPSPVISQLEDPPFTFSNAPSWLHTPTHDGGGQVVHPDMLRFDVSGVLPGNYKYIMAITPYPGGNEDEEVPNILFSQNGHTWEFGPAQNPVVPHRGVEPDPNILYDGTQFYLYWLQFKIGGGYIPGGDYKCLMTSSDGYEYSDLYEFPPGYMVDEVIFDPTDNKFKAFGLANSGSGPHYYLESSDGVVWNRQPLNFPSNPNYPYRYAHREVERLSNGEYWMILGQRQSASGPASRFFAKSNDGINWQGYFGKPVIAPSGGWDSYIIYKSHFIVENGMIRYWYSACDSSRRWHLGYTEAQVPGLDPSVYTVSNIIKPGSPPPPPPPPPVPEGTDLYVILGVASFIGVLTIYYLHARKPKYVKRRRRK